MEIDKWLNKVVNISKKQQKLINSARKKLRNDLKKNKESTDSTREYFKKDYEHLTNALSKLYNLNIEPKELKILNILEKNDPYNNGIKRVNFVKLISDSKIKGLTRRDKFHNSIKKFEKNEVIKRVKEYRGLGRKGVYIKIDETKLGYSLDVILKHYLEYYNYMKERK